MNLFRLLLTETEPVTAAAAAAEAEAGTGNAPMDSMLQMLDIFMLAILVGAGIYALYCAIRLRRTYLLFPCKMLYPGNCSHTDCLDEEGFIHYIFPRILILGIALLVLGGAFAVCRYVLKLDSLIFNICSMVLPLAVLGWYIVVQRKCAAAYWDK